MRKLASKGKHTVKVGNHPYTNKTSKPTIVKTEDYKLRILEMHLKLRDQQLKTTLYIYRLLNQNLMVTANQKSTAGTHTQKKKESKHNITVEENKRGREQKGATKTNPKQLTKW